MTCNYKWYLKVSLLLCKLQVYTESELSPRFAALAVFSRSRGVTEVQRERPASLSTVTRTEMCPLLFLTTTSDKRLHPALSSSSLLYSLHLIAFPTSILLFPPPPSCTLTTLKKQCNDNPRGTVPPKPRGISVFDGWNPITLIASLLYPSPLLKFFALENKYDLD